MEIQKRLPKNIVTYCEPFVGGANVIGNLSLDANYFHASDILEPLIYFYNAIKSNPTLIADYYEQHWVLLQKDPNHFYKVRNEFNQFEQNGPLDITNSGAFFFVCRTSQNGLIRFNKKGLFNASVAHNPDGRTRGANPDNIRKLLLRWQERLSKVEFYTMDYSHSFLRAQTGDFQYIDPPYPSKNSVYQGGFEQSIFYTWLNYLNERGCRWMLSYPYPETPELVALSKRYDVIEAKTTNFANLNRTGKLKEFKEIIYMNYEVENAL